MKISIDNIYKNAIVLIDTCCFVENGTGCQKFFIKSAPYLKETGEKIHIAYKCIEELGKIHHDSLREKRKRDAAAEALKVIQIMENEEFLDVRGSETDSFADSIILQNLIRYFVKYNVVLITQDKGLASDAECLNHFISVTSRKKVIVKNLDEEGNIIDIIPRKKERCL